MNFLFNNDNPFGETVLALGSFDGLHRGHLNVLENALKIAKEKNLTPVVLVFDVHPRVALGLDFGGKIMSDKKRDEILESLGFRIAKANFNEIKNESPTDFLLSVYCKLNARAICCGFNYHFGKNGSGDTALLESVSKKLGILLSVSSAQTELEKPISSSRIRLALSNGEIALANKMLSRPFSISEKIIEGDKRGRILGFPTVNRPLCDDLAKLRFGVYATKVFLDGKWYPSVTNVGIRPTIKTNLRGAETHIIGFSGDLYGREIEIFFLEFLRDECDFGSLEALKNQISKDSEKSKYIFENQNI